MAIAPGISHIWLDANGVAWIDRTNTKVIEVVQDKVAHGWSPEEIHYQHSHLSLAQIHAAFAFYYDHKDELDADMERRYQEVERLQAEAGESPVRKKLRERGFLK